ncbi:CRTAC1 family protein [Ekhidna sp. MALMAid0563]|uniref:CRTAC1 family protein n=1 Tax=Ekhidna sp. MALMAid0563 TaxID=3143937 RepID=UPI0032DF5BFF
MLKSTYLSYFILTLIFCYSCKQSSSALDVPLFILNENGRIATDGGFTRGVAWGDVNQDGTPELYTANSAGQWNAMYSNNGKGGLKKIRLGNVFAELIREGGTSEGVSWVDYDNDGDLDLYLCSRGKEPNQLFRNDSLKRFTKITDHALTRDSISTSMACWADYDLDGDLDVLLVGYRLNGNLFYENEGKGAFRRLSDHLLISGNGTARTCACGDANGDGLPEVFIGNAREPNLYYRNLGNLQFAQDSTGPIIEDEGYAYGSSWADFDDDGDLDLFVANFDKENLLFANNGKGTLNPMIGSIIVTEKGGASKGHSWGDYDNDGDLDIFIGNGTYGPDMHNFLYLNEGDGEFTSYEEGVISQHADTTAGVAHADFDRDGDLDLFIANWGSADQINRLYINQTTGKNWVAFSLKGTKSNAFAIGAHLRIHTPKKEMHRWMYTITGYGSQNDYELHFGLGDETTIDSLIVEWPSGQIDKYLNPETNQHHVLTEGS